MWYNPIMIRLLRSPLHGLTSKSMMLVTYKGRKSGAEYVVPVNYVADGDVLRTVSFRRRTWWRNLRGAAPVTLRVRGQDRQAVGAVIEDEAEVAAALSAYLARAPRLAKYFDVPLNGAGQPDPAAITEAARQRVMVEFQLNDGV